VTDVTEIIRERETARAESKAALRRAVRAETALNWLQENAPLAIWRGSVAATGERIVTITEMDLDGENVIGEPYQAPTLIAAVGAAKEDRP